MFSFNFHKDPRDGNCYSAYFTEQERTCPGSRRRAAADTVERRATCSPSPLGAAAPTPPSPGHRSSCACPDHPLSHLCGGIHQGSQPVTPHLLACAVSRRLSWQLPTQQSYAQPLSTPQTANKGPQSNTAHWLVTLVLDPHCLRSVLAPIAYVLCDLGKSLSFSVPQFLEANSHAYCLKPLWRSNEKMHLEQR